MLQSQFVFSLLYVWCKNEPDNIVQIWGFPIKSGNLPWALTAFSVVTGGNPFHDLIGIAAGHTYIYLKIVLPQSYGKDWLKTPKFIENMVAKIQRKYSSVPGNSRVYGMNNQRVNPNNNAARDPAPNNNGPGMRPFAGRGVRLGGN